MSEFISTYGTNKLSVLLDMLHCLALVLDVYLFYMAIKSTLLAERLATLWTDVRFRNWRFRNYFANFRVICLTSLIAYNIGLIFFFFS